MPLVFSKFDYSKFAKNFVGRKIERYTDEFLDAIGEAVLHGMIDEDKNIIDYISEERQLHFKALAMPYRHFIEIIEPAEAYMWFSERYRTFFELREVGQGWALRQLKLIKTFLMS